MTNKKKKKEDGPKRGFVLGGYAQDKEYKKIMLIHGFDKDEDSLWGEIVSSQGKGGKETWKISESNPRFIAEAKSIKPGMTIRCGCESHLCEGKNPFVVNNIFSNGFHGLMATDLEYYNDDGGSNAPLQYAVIIEEEENR